MSEANELTTQQERTYAIYRSTGWEYDYMDGNRIFLKKWDRIADGSSVLAELIIEPNGEAIRTKRSDTDHIVAPTEMIDPQLDAAIKLADIIQNQMMILRRDDGTDILRAIVTTTARDNVCDTIRSLVERVKSAENENKLLRITVSPRELEMIDARVNDCVPKKEKEQ